MLVILIGPEVAPAGTPLKLTAATLSRWSPRINTVEPTAAELGSK
jgi:hypothetical protein